MATMVSAGVVSFGLRKVCANGLAGRARLFDLTGDDVLLGNG